MLELDCRLLPGTDEPAMRAEVLERLGPELAAVCDIELVTAAPPVVASVDSELYRVLVRADRGPRPGGRAAPRHGPVRDGRQAPRPARRAGLRLLPAPAGAGRGYLERYHGVDERVVARRAPLGPAGPLRRRPPLLRLTALSG